MCKLMAYKGDPFSPDELASFYTEQGRTNPDASGYILFSESKAVWLKSAQRGSLFWEQNGERIKREVQGSGSGMFHVRIATHGSPQNNCNNHPIVHFNKGSLGSAIVHNGIVRPPSWLKSVGQTDTEQLLLYWEKEGPESWAKFGGIAAVVLWSKGRMYCYRSGSPLFFRQTQRGVQLVQIPSGPTWEQVPENRVFEVTAEGLREECEVQLLPALTRTSSAYTSPSHIPFDLMTPSYYTAPRRQLELPQRTGSNLLPHKHSQLVPVGEYQVGAMSVSAPKLKADIYVYLHPDWLSTGTILTGYRSRQGNSDTIYVHWPNLRSFPVVTYRRLVRYIEYLLRRNLRVAVGCLSGHESTGAILAGLIKLLENVTGDEAIQLTRSRYCGRVLTIEEQKLLVREL